MATLIPRTGILNIKPHMLAAPLHNETQALVNLSSNESALGPSPKATAAAQQALMTVERYPDDGPGELASAIGAAMALDPSRIVCGHGSDELLGRLARAYLNPGDEVIHSVHGYLKFPNYAHAMGAIPVAAPDIDFRASVDAILSCVTPKTRMILLANPDNPTGTCLSGEEIRRLHSGLPEQVLLVLDSAYTEYVHAPDYELPTALIDQSHNVVMTRTFSKVYGMAGMRLGWLYGPASVVDVLQRLGLTFPISAPAVAAGVAAVSDLAYTAHVKAYNRAQMLAFSHELKDIGIPYLESNTNFLLLNFDGQPKTAKQAFDALYKNGIAGRMFNSDDYRNRLRITIGLEDEMRRTAAVLRAFIQGG